MREVVTEAKRDQVQRMLRSRAFGGAPGLQRFLAFVTDEEIEGRGSEIKEYTVGVSVFGRPSDFDPRTDTLVRTQAHRLRQKLKEYYASEGASDAVVISVPPGGYVPCYSWRNGSAVGEEESPPVALQGRRSAAGWLLVALGAAALFAVGIWAGLRLAQQSAVAQSASERLLQRFWSGIADGEPVIFSYSNPPFLINDRLHFFRYPGKTIPPQGTPVKESDPAVDRELLAQNGPLFYWGSVTGTGEALALCSIGDFFSRLRLRPLVKRSGLLTVSDLSRNSVVFLGSPSVNDLMEPLHTAGNFVFDDYRHFTPRFMHNHIVNRQPLAGEKATYGVELEEGTRVPTADHAIMSVHPGIARGKRVMVVAGLLSEGTQAAAMYAISPAGIEECLKHLGIRGADGLELPLFFEVLLRVEIVKGEVLRTKYVAGRVLRPARS